MPEDNCGGGQLGRDESVDLEGLDDLMREATSWPLPGAGATSQRLGFLTEAARRDLVVGRLVEAHADAVAIMAELGDGEVGTGRWAVWAAGPPRAVAGEMVGAGRLRISGVKHWCSGASLVSHALVDVATREGQRLVSVDLSQPGFAVLPDVWVNAGMGRADTRSVSFDEVEAHPIGSPGSYLTRRGFWAGAVGVAACWHGGTLRVADTLLDAARDSDDPHLLAHLGAVNAALYANWSCLERAADLIDGSDDSLADVARSVRAIVERHASAVIDRVGRALGPAPLARDRLHAAAVADLTVYVRQHHAERDLEQLGRDVAARAGSWPGTEQRLPS